MAVKQSSLLMVPSQSGNTVAFTQWPRNVGSWYDVVFVGRIRFGRRAGIALALVTDSDNIVNHIA